MNRTRHTVTRFVVMGVLLVAGCTSDPDATASTTPSTRNPPTTASRSSTAPTSPTTELPTTTATTRTALATTTTVDQVAVAKGAAAAAVVQGRQDYLYAIFNLDAPDALTVLANTTAPDSPSWALTIANIDQLRREGWRARPDPMVPSTTTVEGEARLLDGPPATKAEITVCTIDSGVVYEPSGAPDGSDTIVSDSITARRTRVTMVVQDGRWKAYEGTVLGSWAGATSCPAT
jgi:hypothetical protein